MYRARWLSKLDGRRHQRWQSSTTHKSQVTRRRESLLLYVHRFNSLLFFPPPPPPPPPQNRVWNQLVSFCFVCYLFSLDLIGFHDRRQRCVTSAAV